MAHRKGDRILLHAVVNTVEDDMIFVHIQGQATSYSATIVPEAPFEVVSHKLKVGDWVTDDKGSLGVRYKVMGSYIDDTIKDSPVEYVWLKEEHKISHSTLRADRVRRV